VKKQIILDLLPGLLSLGVYLITLSPTITWRNFGADSGDLVTAAFTLGIPHPTGYPLYTLLAAIFSHLLFGEPAKNVSALSALAASGAIILLARTGRALLSDDSQLARWIPPSIALAFAFAPAFWSQATIAEVNALAALFAAALFAILLSDSPHRLYHSAAIFGLGFAHHLTIILLLPAAIILLGPARYTRSQYFRAAILAFVPLALYFYLPIRATTHPPINWGNPETWDGFLWVVSGAPYRQYLFAISPLEILTRVGLIARFLFEQFTVVGVAFGLWGAVRMATDVRQRRAFIALMSAFGITLVYAIVYNSNDSFVYLTPAYLIFALWMMFGLVDVATRLLSFRGSEATEKSLPILSPRFLAPSWRELTPRSWLSIALFALLFLFPLYNLGTNIGKMNLSSDYAAYDYAKNILTSIPPDAVIIADGDEHYFALEYYRYVVTPEKNQIIVSGELLQYAWYFDNIRRVLPNGNASAANHLDRLAEIMDASLAQQRALYTTVQNDSFLPFALERRDNFYRVLGRMP